MAKKKSSANKPAQGTAKKEPVAKKAAAPKSTSQVGSLEEAKKLVKESYANPAHLEYLVLENGHVFYGINRSTGVSYARKFDLKYFDVKL